MSSEVEAYYPAATIMANSEPHSRNSRLPIATSDNPNINHTSATPTVHKSDLQDSQESTASTVSSTFSAPKLPSSSSNLSTSTVADTDFAFQSSNVAFSQSIKPVEASMPPSPNRPRVNDAPAAAPRIDTDAANAPRTGDTAASPMALDSPLAQGFKRTADGTVKGAGVAAHSYHGKMAAHKRNKSMDTHSGTRIGELSAQLKTRLSYAMVKVQNGWEKQSLEELEEVHSQRGSPNSAPGRSDRLAFESPLTFDRRRRPSGVSENSDQMIMSPASDPARSHAATPSLYWRATTKPAMTAAANLISVTGSQQGLGLAPALEIQPGRRRRSSVSHPPPPLIGTGQRKHFSDLGVGQQAPATPRAGILRMPSQQAEKDAVDTLLFMSSPNNSGRFPHTSQTAPSPLRTDAPQRRVMFEAYPPQEKRSVYHQMPPPPHHQYGPYAAHPAR
ncbi:hypothetical protein FB567DRAFT_528597 [Paraphoma chrysanthemicola]|uniref:Cyclin-dependent kinase n=1 Tax=Paraphoma chrysanthemicola TaxID=798071 RepID=A0A8K0VWW4_9PLEO|nr:hypothetical protein FB567DRAFT_528597 [Paraphoma chrysanthemicola]